MKRPLISPALTAFYDLMSFNWPPGPFPRGSRHEHDWYVVDTSYGPRLVELDLRCGCGAVWELTGTERAKPWP